MTEFIFCHGFGFSKDFFNRLEPYFANEKCSFIDLGYFGNPSENLKLNDKKLVAIGHSLGFSKLIEMKKDFSALIGINSFTNFLGNEINMQQKRKLELNLLRQNLILDPINTLKNFYKRCGVKELIDYCDWSNLNMDLLLSDLKYLENEVEIPNIDILILSSIQDVVVPSHIAEENFLKKTNIKFEFIDQVDHGLGFTEPLVVYEKIMKFLDDKFDKEN